MDLVPDKIWGLDITEACNIHDWTWDKAFASWDEFRRWNLVFLNNLMRIISAKTKWKWLRILRRRRALKYYQAVEEFGASIFWDSKNEK